MIISVMNKNDKQPYFLPATVRTQITENTPVGSKVVRLNATDADVTDDLVYAIVEPITAVNKDGKKVEDEDSRFKTFFQVSETKLYVKLEMHSISKHFHMNEKSQD